MESTSPAFQIYPNPANDMLYIKSASGITGEFKIVLSNVIGQTLSMKETGSQNGFLEASFNVSDLPAGIYFLTVSSHNTKEVLKVEKY